jgi:malate dehydrogenase
MSRDDLLFKNAEIVRSVTASTTTLSPNAIIIMVTNPLDVMAYMALKASGFEPHRVIGMAGVLDTSRFRYFVSEALNVSVEDVTAFVLGGHGDSMVPLPRYCSVAGIPLPELMDADKIEALVERTRKGGAEIVAYLKTGSAFYAPSASVVQIIESIVKDKKRILPCAAWLTGQYDIRDVFVGVPVKLGAKGIEEIIEINLTSEEHQALKASAAHVKQTMTKLQL